MYSLTTSCEKKTCSSGGASNGGADADDDAVGNDGEGNGTKGEGDSATGGHSGAVSSELGTDKVDATGAESICTIASFRESELDIFEGDGCAGCLTRLQQRTIHQLENN